MRWTVKIDELVDIMIDYIRARGAVRYVDAYRHGQSEIRRRHGREVRGVGMHDVLHRLYKRDVELIRHKVVFRYDRVTQVRRPRSIWSLYMQVSMNNGIAS